MQAPGFQFHPQSLHWLHLAWLVPALLLLYLHSFYRKGVALRGFAGEVLLRHLIPSVSWGRQYARAGLVLAGVLLLALGLARPQWGTDIQEIRRKGIDLVVLLDLSRSMLAQDMGEGRSRLEWAKADLGELLGGLSGDRVALVPFAGRAEIRCPLTFDYGFFRRILSELSIGSVGLGGTNVSAALHKALECFQDNVKNHKAILLITDGEDHEAYVKEAAEKARERGVRIFSIGVGDTGEGKRIPITDEQGNQVYLKDKEGKEVWSKMDPRVLLEAAQVTDGGYAPAYLKKQGEGGGITTVRDLYEKITEKVARSEIEGAKEERFQDRFQWLLGLAWLLLALEPLLSTRKRPGRVAAAGLALLLAWLPAPAAAGEYERLLAEGNRLFAQGDYPAAEGKYLEARTTRQDSPEVAYNIANTHFQRGEFLKAIEGYGEALRDARERDLELRIRYNLSCARARESERFVGDLTSAENLQKGVDLLREAIGGFRDVLEIDPVHEGARKNLAIAQLRVKSLLDQLKRLQEEAEKRAREEDQGKKSPVEVLKELIAEERAELGLTAAAREAGGEVERLKGQKQRVEGIDKAPGRAALLEELLKDPAFAAGGAEASQALKLERAGDAAGASRKLAEAGERLARETAAREESRSTALEKDRSDQTSTLAKAGGLAVGLRDAAQGKPPPAPPPEVAERLVRVAELTEGAASEMGEAVAALGAPDLEKAEAEQRQALELLEKALAEAEKLPQEKPPEEQDRKQEDDQEKKDQDKKDQDKKDGGSKNGEDEKKRDEKQDQGQKEPAGKQDEKRLSKDEAEKLLRKFLQKDADRQRSRDQKAMGAGGGRMALDKDW